MENQPKISVINAVYRAENYISRCLESLFEQTLDDVEFVFVDDASPDKSIEIVETWLNKYPHRKEFTKIIRHKQNMGVSATRRDGLDVCTGEYIIACDPDDWIDRNMYEEMFSVANESGADMVRCDYILEWKNKSQVVTHDFQDTISSQEIIDAFINGTLEGYTPTFLIKRSIISEHNITFINGINLCEDLMFLLKVASHSKKIAYLKAPFYHYDQYSNSSSLRVSINHSQDV